MVKVLLYLFLGAFLDESIQRSLKGLGTDPDLSDKVSICTWAIILLGLIFFHFQPHKCAHCGMKIRTNLKEWHAAESPKKPTKLCYQCHLRLVEMATGKDFGDSPPADLPAI